MNGLYLYGAAPGEIRPDEHPDAGGAGVNLECVTHNEVSVFFSEAPSGFFSRNSREAILSGILTHKKTVDLLYSRTRVIPFKIGTIVSDAGKIMDLLSCSGNFLKDIFNRTKGLDEWNIIISFSDMQEALRKAGEAAEVLMLREQIQKKESVTQEDLIIVGRVIKESTDRMKEEIAGRLLPEIKSISDCIFVNDMRDERTVLSMAVLTNREGIAGLEDLLEGFTEEENLTACVSGPMPPYSFYTLEVRRIGREELVRALAVLGMAGVPGHREIVKAKRALLQRIHPDKLQDHAAGQVQPVLEAFELLDRYYRRSGYAVEKLEDFYTVGVVSLRGSQGKE